ncbi:MAG: hypothetical protein NTX13_05590 [Acidobacteria bacterium]|nr:hypothetical protein [Acidobacteriota bacterium]
MWIKFVLLSALAGAGLAAPVALIVDAPSPLPPGVASSFRQEIDQVFRETGYHFTWIDRARMRPEDSFPDLVVLRLQSECRMDAPPAPLLPSRVRALAWAHRTGDEVLPFIEVDCARVRHMLRVLAHGEPAAAQQEMIGRALGRVVAHELYHVLTGSPAHASVGIAQASLSPTHLVSPTLAFTPREINLLSQRSLAARSLTPAAPDTADEAATESGR